MEQKGRARVRRTKISNKNNEDMGVHVYNHGGIVCNGLESMKTESTSGIELKHKLHKSPETKNRV